MFSQLRIVILLAIVTVPAFAKDVASCTDQAINFSLSGKVVSLYGASAFGEGEQDLSDALKFERSSNIDSTVADVCSAKNLERLSSERAPLDKMAKVIKSQGNKIPPQYLGTFGLSSEQKGPLSIDQFCSEVEKNIKQADAGFPYNQAITAFTQGQHLTPNRPEDCKKLTRKIHTELGVPKIKSLVANLQRDLELGKYSPAESERIKDLLGRIKVPTETVPKPTALAPAPVAPLSNTKASSGSAQ